MSSRHIRPIAAAAAILLTLGLALPAQAKPLAAGAAFHGQGGVLEALTACGASLARVLKLTSAPWCGTGYCPTPPPPPPPGSGGGQTMSSIVKPHPAGKGSLP